jgi:hypothetical protein
LRQNARCEPNGNNPEPRAKRAEAHADSRRNRNDDRLADDSIHKYTISMCLDCFHLVCRAIICARREGDTPAAISREMSQSITYETYGDSQQSREACQGRLTSRMRPKSRFRTSGIGISKYVINGRKMMCFALAQFDILSQSIRRQLVATRISETECIRVLAE